MDPTAINPEIVSQIVEAVTRHAPSIWAAGSAAAVTAAKTLGKGALSKLSGELVEGLISRLRGKSKEAPKDRAEIERIVREVLQADPGFAQQVQVCFRGPVAYPGGGALQFLGSAHLQFGESGATAAAPATAPTPAATPPPGPFSTLVSPSHSWRCSGHGWSRRPSRTIRKSVQRSSARFRNERQARTDSSCSERAGR